MGVWLKALNLFSQRNYRDLLHEFVPQILLLWCLFGYMDLLIITKWLTDYSGHEHEAPSIISTMINMALNGGIINGRPFIGSASTNKAISLMLMVVAVLCIPWMLFVKPLKIRQDMKVKL